MPTNYAPDTLARADEWLSQALCIGQDPDIWFGWDHMAEAKRICNRCPVRETCLATAMANEAKANWSRYGIYGGLTARERKALA